MRAPIVQFEFLRNRNFFGALTVAFVISFAMLGMFFFMALYIQNILGYSPLEAGRPVPADDARDHGRRPDRRADRPTGSAPRPLIVAGLGLVAVSLFLQSQIDDTSGYGLAAGPVHPDGLRDRH